MRARFVVAVMALAVCTQATSVSARKTSRSPFYSAGLEAGAVYEANLRVAPADVEEYLSLYAKWIFPVDMAPKSGRKLLTALSREIGDDHNLVFLYWYESRYKEQYYCNFAREFFAYHLNNAATQAELRALYKEASRLLGESLKDDRTINEELSACQGNDVPPAVAETIRRVEGQLRRLSVSEEDSWNFGVNPCRVQKIADADKMKAKVTPSDLETCARSLLEEMVYRLPTAGAKGMGERK